MMGPAVMLLRLIIGNARGSSLMTPHPDYHRFLDILRDCPCGALDRTVFRSVASQYAGDADLLTGAGSLKEGGRWNSRGLFRVVYASFDDHTALAESKAKFLAYGFSRADRRTIVPLRATLQRVLSLEDVVLKLGVAMQDLLNVDWRTTQDAGQEPITQAIGRAANELAVQGLQAPSDRYPSGINIILLRNHIQVPAELEILAPSGPHPM